MGQIICRPHLLILTMATQFTGHITKTLRSAHHFTSRNSQY